MVIFNSYVKLPEGMIILSKTILYSFTITNQLAFLKRKNEALILWAGSMVGSWGVSGFQKYSRFKGSVNIHNHLHIGSMYGIYANI